MCQSIINIHQSSILSYHHQSSIIITPSSINGYHHPSSSITIESSLKHRSIIIHRRWVIPPVPSMPHVLKKKRWNSMWGWSCHKFHCLVLAALQQSQSWSFPKSWGYPQIIHCNRILHYKPSSVGNFDITATGTLWSGSRDSFSWFPLSSAHLQLLVFVLRLKSILQVNSGTTCWTSKIIQSNLPWRPVDCPRLIKTNSIYCKILQVHEGPKTAHQSSTKTKSKQLSIFERLGGVLKYWLQWSSFPFGTPGVLLCLQLRRDAPPTMWWATLSILLTGWPLRIMLPS